MIIEVELCSFKGDFPGNIRKVDIPDKSISPELTTSALLEMVFHFGQNDTQQQSMIRSVSVGDIIRYNGNRYVVDSVGFQEVE